MTAIAPSASILIDVAGIGAPAPAAHSSSAAGYRGLGCMTTCRLSPKPVLSVATSGWSARVMMDDAPFVGRHRLQVDGPARAGHPLRDPFRQVGHRLVPPLLVPLDVQHQHGPVAELPAHDGLDQELQRPQGLASPADEQPRVVALDLEYRSAQLLPVRLLQVDYGVDSQLGDERRDDFGRNRHEVRRTLQACDSYPGRLAPQPQYPGAPPANDVYFYLVALGVELL